MDILNAYRLIRRNYNDSNLAAIQKYLGAGGDPNYPLCSGLTVFLEAAIHPSDNIGVIGELINAGADVNVCNHLGFTPLHYAVALRKQLVVDALIQSGASVNAKDCRGKTALHQAVSRWKYGELPTAIRPEAEIRILEKLLKHESIDLNPVDLNGNTPLMMAVKNNNLITVLMLLIKDANPNICNNVSETPLHVAFSLPQNLMEIELLLRGASIYSIDKNEQTPLDVLIKNGFQTREEKRIKVILKIIAFKFYVTSDLQRKFEHIPHLSKFFKHCCDQVDHMKGDFISGNITVHDFLWSSFEENDFKFLLLHIHKPVVERLIRGFYSEYLIHILWQIPKFSLVTILQMTACSKKRRSAKGKEKDLADLLSIFDIIYSLSNHLSQVEIFYLIRAFSEVTIYE